MQKKKIKTTVADYKENQTLPGPHRSKWWDLLKVYLAAINGTSAATSSRLMSAMKSLKPWDREHTE